MLLIVSFLVMVNPAEALDLPCEKGTLNLLAPYCHCDSLKCKFNIILYIHQAWKRKGQPSACPSFTVDRKLLFCDNKGH